MRLSLSFATALVGMLPSVALAQQVSDFALTSAVSSPQTVQIGQTLMVSGTVTVSGAPFSGNVPVQVLLSGDMVADAGDPELFRGLVFIASPGPIDYDLEFDVHVTRGLGVPAGLAQHVIVVLDPDNTVTESDETNNVAVASMLTIRGSDIRVVSIVADPNAFHGVAATVTVTFENSGEVDANAFHHRYYLSQDPLIRIFDTELYTAGPVTVPAGTTQAFQDVVVMPDNTVISSGMWFLGVVADIHSELFEISDTNNTGVLRPPLLLRSPIPDLVPRIVETATAGAAGESFAVTRLISNDGVAPAQAVSFRYVLSTDERIDPSDIALSDHMLGSLAVGDDYGTDRLMFPSTVPGGTYYLGVVVDEANTIEEVFEDNNVAFSAPFRVFESTLRITTSILNPATLGVDYEAGIYATNGPLPTTFSVASGALPAGITLSPGGIVSGVPTEEGVFDFVVRASSGSAYADGALSLRVAAPSVTPEIVTRRLPAAFAGRRFCHRLVAVGGQLPYRWRSITTAPAGATFSEDGFLCGTVAAPRTYEMTIEVADDVGVTASARIDFHVIHPSDSIEIDQVPLPSGIVGINLCDPTPIRFTSSQGVDPVSWSVIDGDVPGLTLASNGELCGVPDRAGAYVLTVRAQDSIELFDTALFVFEVIASNTFAIATFVLPDGQVAARYEAELQAVRGAEPVSWAVVDAVGTLPPGLALDERGSMSGIPTEPGTFAFAVEAIDAKNQRAVQPYAIVVGEKDVLDVAPPSCICVGSSNPAPGGVIALLFIALGLYFTQRGRGVIR